MNQECRRRREADAMLWRGSNLKLGWCRKVLASDPPPFSRRRTRPNKSEECS